MPESDDRYARLDAARWLAAVAVVMLHGAATVVSDPAAYGSGAWLAANLCDSAARWCVPVFVMISGALLLDPERPQDARRFYSRRVARICAPLLFWTLFYLLWRTALDWIDDGRLDLSFWPRKLAHGEPYYHLWYLYMIVGLYLFAPLVRALAARSSRQARALWVVGILGLAILDALYRRALDAPPGFFPDLVPALSGVFRRRTHDPRGRAAHSPPRPDAGGQRGRHGPGRVPAVQLTDAQHLLL